MIFSNRDNRRTPVTPLRSTILILNSSTDFGTPGKRRVTVGIKLAATVPLAARFASEV